MANYTPDKWVVIKLSSQDSSYYKVFACWYGGFAGNDSWKMNSGITSIIEYDTYYVFAGSSGSTYTCSKDTYGTHFYGQAILLDIIRHAGNAGVNIEVLNETVNFSELKYE